METREVFSKVLEWGVIGLLSLVAIRLHDWWKGISFHADDWRLYLEPAGTSNVSVLGVPLHTIGDTCFTCRIKLFNRSARVTGLHRVSLQFGTGRLVFRRVFFEINEPLASRELTLVPGEWVVSEASGMIEDKRKLRSCTTVWLCASDIGRRRKRTWLIAHLTPQEVEDSLGKGSLRQSVGEGGVIVHQIEGI